MADEHKGWVGAPPHIREMLQKVTEKLDSLGGTCSECGAEAEQFRYPAVAYFNSLGVRPSGRTCSTCGLAIMEAIR